jgi:hypothetical protein
MGRAWWLITSAANNISAKVLPSGIFADAIHANLNGLKVWSNSWDEGELEECDQSPRKLCFINIGECRTQLIEIRL